MRDPKFRDFRAPPHPLGKAKGLLDACVMDGEPFPLAIHTLPAYDLYASLRWLITAHKHHEAEIGVWQERCETLKAKVAELKSERDLLAALVDREPSDG